MQSKKIIFLIIILLLSQFLYPNKYYLLENWLFLISDSDQKEWKHIDIKKSLTQQGIELEKNQTINYKYLIDKNNLLLLTQKNGNLGIYFGKIEGITRIYFNNQLVFSSNYFDKIAYFRIENDSILKKNEILVVVKKNNTTFTAKSDSIPYIYNYEKINMKLNLYLFLLLFIGLNLFLMGLFFLTFFHSKLKNYEYLIFFFLCLCASFYAILKSSLKFYIIDFFNINWLITKKIDYFFLYLNPFLGFLFLSIITAIKNKWIYISKKILFIFTIVIIFSELVLDFERMRLTLIIYYLEIIYSYIVVLYLIIKSILNKKKEFYFILIGILFLILFSILDIASIWHFLDLFDKFPFYVVGFFIFLYSNGFYLSKEFLAINLDYKELNITLEQKVHDRTKDLQKAKDQIEQKEKQKTIAFTNIFHEIKTPLTLISNYVEKHIKNYGTTEEIKIARDNIDKLKRDVLNALDFEKLDKGMIFYDHLQITDIADILRMNIFIYKEIAYKKGIEVKLNIQDNIYAKIDQNSIDKIINNLIDNAVKYTPNNGKIDISLKADNKNIELKIKDTGIGISKEELKHIFKPYYQISLNKSNIQGIGMGLNIVKKIIDKANGKIKVESEKSKGTTFIIKFKRYFLKDKDKVEFKNKDKRYAIDVMDIKLKEQEYKKDKHNIFVVEDNLQMLSYLQESLYDKYNFYYAINGKEALEKLGKNPKPDIIISDIMMDVMDGYDFFDELKKIGEKYKSIPFIFLTAKTLENEKIKGLKKGAIDFISKPFSMEELLAKIESIIKIKNNNDIISLANEVHNYLINKASEKTVDGIEEKEEIEKNKTEVNKLYIEYGMSKREIDVLNLLFKGFMRKEIAYELNISIGSVRTYMSRIFKKCNVNSKRELLKIFNIKSK